MENEVPDFVDPMGQMAIRREFGNVIRGYAPRMGNFVRGGLPWGAIFVPDTVYAPDVDQENNPCWGDCQ